MPDNPHSFWPVGSAALHFADRFQSFGANAAWFHGFDPAAFDLCAAHAIAPCVEFKTFRADFATHPELVPTGLDGKPIRYGDLVQGVCLAQKDFLDETEAHLLEGVSNFQPAGIWLDYLTYAGWFETPEPDLQESCFAGIALRILPGDRH
jgi:RecJ-like exonuclease